VINLNYSGFRVTELNEKTVAFQLTGDFDKHVSSWLHEEILCRIKQQNVILDLSRVNSIDTSAVALLVECLRISESIDKTFKVIGINTRVKDTLEMLKLSSIFENIKLYQIPRTNGYILSQPRNSHNKTNLPERIN
jgi:anti-anti-sigma factor